MTANKSRKRGGAKKQRKRWRVSKAARELTRLFAKIFHQKNFVHPYRESLGCLFRLPSHLRLFCEPEGRQDAAQFLFIVWCQSFGFNNDLGEGRKQFDQAIKSLTEKRRGRPPSKRTQKGRQIKEEDRHRTVRQMLEQIHEGWADLKPEEQKHEIEKFKAADRQQRRRTKGRLKGQGE